MLTKITELEKWALTILHNGMILGAIADDVMPAMLNLEKKQLAIVQYNDGTWNFRLTPLGEKIAAMHAPSSYRYFPVTNQQLARDTARLHNTVREIANLMIASEQDWSLSEDALTVINEILYTPSQQAVEAKDIDISQDDKMAFIILCRILSRDNTTISDKGRTNVMQVAMRFMEMGLVGNTGTTESPCFYITPTGHVTLNCIFLGELDFWSRGATLMEKEKVTADNNTPKASKRQSKSKNQKDKKNNENPDAKSAQQE